MSVYVGRKLRLIQKVLKLTNFFAFIWKRSKLPQPVYG